MAILTPLVGGYFTPEQKAKIKADLEGVVALAWLMISDDGKLEPDTEEEAATITRVEEFIKTIK